MYSNSPTRQYIPASRKHPATYHRLEESSFAPYAELHDGTEASFGAERTRAESATTSAIAYQIASSLFRATLKESYLRKPGRIRRLCSDKLRQMSGVLRRSPGNVRSLCL